MQSYITIYLLLILIGIYLFLNLKDRYKKRNKKHQNIPTEQLKEIVSETTEAIETEPNQDAGDYKNKYQKRYLLTKNEYQEFRKLKQFASAKELIVCPKVRLLDLIEPRRGAPKYKSLLYKIQSKHVDFVICDQNLYVKAILELDDNSHDQADRQERDNFVDLILNNVGYTVIRTRSVTDNTLDSIT